MNTDRTINFGKYKGTPIKLYKYIYNLKNFKCNSIFYCT